MVDSEAADRVRLTGKLHRISRRSFLIGSITGVVLSTDLVVTREIQTEREQLTILPIEDEEAERWFPHAAWLLFPGFKVSWNEALWILNSLKPALRQRGQMAAIGYSNKGLNIDDIVSGVRRYIREHHIRKLYFYGHSFGGMVAVQVTARLKALDIDVDLIILDSSPHSKYDVLDQTWFDGVVVFSETNIRVPSLIRGTFELSERVVHKNERTWRTILDQTLAQLSPLAVSTRLILSESSYIYHWDYSRFAGKIGDTKLVFIGNPNDGTVDYQAARAGWSRSFPQNVVSTSLQTTGALPPHASPQWNPGVYQHLVEIIEDRYLTTPVHGPRRYY